MPRTHRAEYSATVAHLVQCGYRSGDRTLGAMPVAHTMGIRSLLAMVFVNGLYVPVASVGEGRMLDLLAEREISCLYLALARWGR